MLITDHNVRETLSVTDRAYIIAEGKIFRAGTPARTGQRRGGAARLSWRGFLAGLMSAGIPEAATMGLTRICGLPTVNPPLSEKGSKRISRQKFPNWLNSVAQNRESCPEMRQFAL
jgi:ABC-type multidrug transport system ATPase subunit